MITITNLLIAGLALSNDAEDHATHVELHGNLCAILKSHDKVAYDNYIRDGEMPDEAYSIYNQARKEQ